MRSAALGFLFALCVLALPGCDLLGSGSGGGPGVDGVPPERLVAMVAVYGSQEDPAHRLVVADLKDPAHYKVLRKAGNEVGGTCFSPDKRRILFADHSESNVGTRAPLKLYDLETGEVRPLNGAPAAATHDGSLECTWSADGSGFYYQAAGGAGATYPIYYNLESEEAHPFGPMGRRFHGLKGHDSLLVNMGPLYEPEAGGASTFCFIDAQTEEVLECLKNEYLKFIPWEDESRGGWKQAAYEVNYSDDLNLVAFRRSAAEGPEGLAITDLEGSLLETNSKRGVIRCIRWVDRRSVLFDHRPEFGSPWSAIRVMVWDTEANEVRELVAPEVIDGAIGLHLPDY